MVLEIDDHRRPLRGLSVLLFGSVPLAGDIKPTAPELASALNLLFRLRPGPARDRS
jgi:hypothetical protein